MNNLTEEKLVQLANVKTVEELNNFLEENGIMLEDGVTPEAFLETLTADSGELSADDLDNVSGGGILEFTLSIAIAAAKLGLSIALYLRRYQQHKIQELFR